MFLKNRCKIVYDIFTGSLGYKIEKAILYINNNYKSNLNLNILSKEAGYVPSHFSRIFNEISGKSYKEYIAEFRINKAIENLIVFNKSITEIAFNNGFGSITSFNRVFKKLKGVSPKEFKKLYNGSDKN